MGVSWGVLPGVDAGFTGTRRNISAPQRVVLMSFLMVKHPVSVHYGDCTGADYEFYMLCTVLGGIWRVSHPCDIEKYRMFTLADEMRDPKPPLERNKDIVAESDYLVACPGEDQEIIRSGTWSTVRAARRSGLPVAVIYPDGRVDIQGLSRLHWRCIPGWGTGTWCRSLNGFLRGGGMVPRLFKFSFPGGTCFIV